jgi:PAS domain S-box-containing protein
MRAPGVLTAVRSTGERFPIEATISQVQAGEAKLYSVILRDITERRQAEACLQADISALTQMHALSGKVLGAVGFQPLLQEVMDAAVAIMKADRGTLQLLEGDSLRIVAHHGHQPRFLEFFASAENRASVCGEAMLRGERVVVPDVEESPLFAETPSLPVLREAGVRAVQSTPLVSRAGKLLGILTTQWAVRYCPGEHDLWRIDLLARQAADLIEHAKAEEALRSSEAKMHGIVGSAMDAIISVDEQQRIVVFNRAAEQIFQCSASEALGSSLDRFLPPEYREAHGEHVRKFGASGITSRSMRAPGVLTAVRSNGERFPIEATISQVQAGEQKLYTVILRDITERKRAEEVLLRSEKLSSVGRMAATIAHEINNPLGAVTNLLFLTKTSNDLPESARQYLEVADAELRRIAHITQQSLGFYRESNAPALTSVNTLLESAADLLKSRIKTKRAMIEKQWDEDIGVTAVAGELRQVFSNLLANSLDAIDEEGIIKLRVSAHPAFKNGDRCVRVTIADNGKGIDASSRPHLFEPFFTTKGAIGTGLGLWVSKQLIDKHGGTIRMRSSTNGARRGTVFSVVLPVDPAAGVARPQSAGA